MTELLEREMVAHVRFTVHPKTSEECLLNAGQKTVEQELDYSTQETQTHSKFTN